MVARKRTGKQGPDSIRTPELGALLIAGISDGVSLRQLCREHKISKSAVYDWIDADQEFAGLIAHARVRGFDQIAEQALEIADDGTRDYSAENADGGVSVNYDHIQRSKLRVETRLKLLAKWDPKRYGDKVQHANAEGGMLPIPDWHLHPVSAK